MKDSSGRLCKVCGNKLREVALPPPSFEGATCDLYMCEWRCDCCDDAARRAALNEKSGL